MKRVVLAFAIGSMACSAFADEASPSDASNFQPVKPDAGLGTTVLANDSPLSNEDVTPTFASNFEDMKLDLGLGFSYTSNNQGWGVSSTNNHPGVLAYASPSYGPFYSNVIWYNTDYGDVVDFKHETDTIYGFRPVWGNFQFNIAYLYYFAGPDANYWDTFAAVNYNVTEKLNVGYTHWWSGDYANLGFNKSLDQFNIKYQLSEKFSVSAEYGKHHYQDYVEGDANYTHWTAGVAYQITPSWRADVLYHATNRTRMECAGGTDWCEPGVQFSISVDTTVRQLLKSM